MLGVVALVEFDTEIVTQETSCVAASGSSGFPKEARLLHLSFFCSYWLKLIQVGRDFANPNVLPRVARAPDSLEFAPELPPESAALLDGARQRRYSSAAVRTSADRAARGRTSRANRPCAVIRRLRNRGAGRRRITRDRRAADRTADIGQRRPSWRRGLHRWCRVHRRASRRRRHRHCRHGLGRRGTVGPLKWIGFCPATMSGVST